MFVAQSALELNRLRNKQPVATLTASATATMPRAATPKAPTNVGKYAKKYGFDTQSSAALQKTRKRAATTTPKAETVEFSQSERSTWRTLIALNAIGDVADVAGIFVGPGTAVSLTFDAILFLLNMHYIGMNPKQKKAIKGKGSTMWFLKRIGIEQIPIVEILYFRSYGIYRLYKQRIKAANEGI